MNNRAKRTGNLYVALVVILMVVAVIAAVAGAMNRSRQKAEESEAKGTTSVTEALTDVDTDNTVEDVFSPSKDKETEAETEAGDEETESTAAEALPEFVNPTGGALLNEYSIEVPVFSVTMEDYRTHNGVDICVQMGERVLAAADGVIKEIWEDPMMGTCISISHAAEAESVYKNLSPEIPEGIAVGAEVAEGTFIAVSGESALAEIAEDPHIHFELKVNGEYVDPCDYIDFSNAEEVYEG